MVSVDEEYKFVSEQTRYHNEKIIEALNLFIRLFSAIVGGSIWLSTQAHIPDAKIPSLVWLSDTTVILLTGLCCILVYENLRAWHGYRRAQSRLGSIDESGIPRIPPPRRLHASRTETAMIGFMILAAILFCRFNPFTL
jgi:TRAP-type C4-dicarboxylate transport system permease small subunit